MSDINVDTPGASGANPTATASDVAVNGSAATFMRSDGAPAVQKTSASVFGLCKVDGSTITASGGVITAITGGSGTGNVTGPASSTDTAIATWNGTSGTALRNNSATLIDASGNISTTGKFSATGNVSGGNLTTAGVVSATGNVSGGNLTTAGLVSATGNVSGGNLTTAGNVTGANIGNITPINLDGNSSHVLLGNGTFGASPGGASDFTKITSVTTSGSQGNVTFSSITGSYKHLQLRITSRSDDPPTSELTLFCQVNGDTGSNYSTQRFFSFGSSGYFADDLILDTKLYIGVTVGDAATTGNTGATTIDILNYTNTTWKKNFISDWYYIRDNGGTRQVRGGSGGVWHSTSAITSLKFYPAAGNWKDGSIFDLYGIN